MLSSSFYFIDMVIADKYRYQNALLLMEQSL